MSLSTCLHCGGHIPLGPDASNRCETCGKYFFDSPDPILEDGIEDYRPAWIAAMAERDAEIRETDALKVRLVEAAKEINALRAQVANLESQVAAAAEPWHVQSAMLNAVTTERDRFKNCLEYIAGECDYEETVPTKRWLQQVAADVLDPEIDHHD